MELTKKQNEGLKIVLNKYKAKEKYVCISGYAGSGKSTLVKFIIDALNIDSEYDVAYCAYTGKAAQVLREKGCPNATTAHKLLFTTIQRGFNQYEYIPKDSLDYKVVVVDEVSMLPVELWNLLLTYNVFIIALGDPGQLPSLSGSAPVLQNPDIFLDEIMRQAQESEIIRLTMDIREGKFLKPFKGKEVNILSKKDYFPEMLDWPDQIICATNDTRKILNETARKLQWGDKYSATPLIGDKIICCHNSSKFNSLDGDLILANGLTGTLTKFDLVTEKAFNRKKRKYYSLMNAIIDFDTEDGHTFSSVRADYNFLLTGKESINGENFSLIPQSIHPIPFDYGKAITCHKSQGSQWNKVLVVEERFPFSAEEHKRWLYTAATRPSEKLTLILKD